MEVVSLPRAKHASLGKACRNILPSSCEVIGIGHLSPHVAYKCEGTRPLTRDNGQRRPAINGVGTEPHTSKDPTTIAGALALMQTYHSREGMLGKDISQLQGTWPHAMSTLSIVGSTVHFQ